MKTLLLYGTGLIGGSFALAARKHKLFDCVLGADNNDRNLAQAIDVGICDDVWRQNVDVDGVCVAVPNGSIGSAVKYLANIVGNDVPIFDVGSVKLPIVDELEDVISNFVPCHPIAGSDQSGPRAASPGLFEGSTCVLTPVRASSVPVIDYVKGWWREIGMRVIELSPERHDEYMALTSHLPHLLAFAYLDVFTQKTETIADFVGSGFKDFSRLAGSDPLIWRDILTANRQRLKVEVKEFESALHRLVTLIDDDPDVFQQELARISKVRRDFDG